MPNPFEKIAQSEKDKAVAKQQSEVEQFAKKIAKEVLANANFTHGKAEIEEIISGLSVAVAGAITLSNQNIDTQLTDNFSKLLDAVRDNKPDNSQIELSLKVGEKLVALENAFKSIELSPIINVEGISIDDLRAEVAKILEILPSDSRRLVTLAYEDATPDKYINARLTNGIQFYEARGGGGVVVNGEGGSGGGLTNDELRAEPLEVTGDLDINTAGLATEAKQDDLIAAIGAISGTTNTTTRIATVGNLTYIGNAAIGASASGSVWQIKRLDATSGLIKLWADGNDNFDNIWNDRESLTYS